MSLPDQTILVVTNVPNDDVARSIAGALVEQRLAACVNCIANVTSFYRWQGAVEQASEITLLIKTRQACYAAVEAAIRQLHPYELPEIISVAVQQGLGAYMQWIAQETRQG